MISVRTLSLLRALSNDVGTETDDVVRALAAAWVDAWDRLSLTWQDAIGDIVQYVTETGKPPSTWVAARMERLTLALVQTRTALNVLAEQSTNAAAAGAYNAIALTAIAEPAVMASQLPAGIATAALNQYAAKVLPHALEAIATRARQQIQARHYPLAADAVEAMKRALISGIATGANPRTVARDMLRLTESHFNGGLHRALVIARTEMLDAHRDTSQQIHQANRTVVRDWIWLCSLDHRSCPSCWGMHGTAHPIDQPGPHDHQQGRCARLVRLKSWADLGFGGIEEDDATPDALEAFDALDQVDQLAIMGPRRLAMLKAGTIGLGDLARKRKTEGWRDSYVPRTLGQLDAVQRRRTR